MFLYLLLDWNERLYLKKNIVSPMLLKVWYNFSNQYPYLVYPNTVYA